MIGRYRGQTFGVWYVGFGGFQDFGCPVFSDGLNLASVIVGEGWKRFWGVWVIGFANVLAGRKGRPD